MSRWWSWGNARFYYGRLYAVQGVRLLWRNRFWSTITFVVLSLLLSLVYVMAVVSKHTEQAARKVDQQLVVTAVIAQQPACQTSPGPQTCAPAADPHAIATQVSHISYVSAVTLVTPTQARNLLFASLYSAKGTPHDAPQAQADAWVFKWQLQISVRDTARMEFVRSAVAAIPGVQSASYLSDVVQKLGAYNDHQRRLAEWLAAILAFVSILITVAVVRTSLHSQQRTVQTMSAVGGSTWVIAAPIMVQMLIVSVLASALACAVGFLLDPEIGTSFGQSAASLPSWLRTGRAYGPGALMPFLVIGSSTTATLCVAWGAWRHAR